MVVAVVVRSISFILIVMNGSSIDLTLSLHYRHLPSSFLIPHSSFLIPHSSSFIALFELNRPVIVVEIELLLSTSVLHLS